MSEGNKPIRTTRLGQVKLVVWENKKDDIITKSFNIEKSYKPKNSEEWKTTTTLYKGDLQNIKILIEAELQKEIKN